MSVQPTHFTHNVFTSTLTDHKDHIIGINIYIILLTAILFFSVLAWFNFALALYGTLTTTDSNHVDTTLQNLGFAIMWTIIVVAIYYMMVYLDALELPGSSNEHPLLREGRLENRAGSVSGRVESGLMSGDYLGRVDVAGI